MTDESVKVEITDPVGGGDRDDQHRDQAAVGCHGTAGP